MLNWQQMELRVNQVKKFKNALQIIFDKPKIHFYPGQYLDVKVGQDSRSFTISSSPTEGFLMITTRPGISRFKKKFIKLKSNEIIQSSHPAGTFILDEKERAVFLAGGVGITPFRSMIKYAFDKSLKAPITLIYSKADSDFIFKDELKTWQKFLPNLAIHWINTKKVGRLTKETLYQLTMNYEPLTIYYLAGSPAFVDDLEKILLELGIEETNIRTDRFDGY